MPNLNLVILAGHLGQDPEMRYSASGTAIATLSLATSWGKKDPNTGEWENFTDWHRVVAFGKLAEKVGELAEKGSPILVEGTIRYESWEKEGEKRYATKIIANKINILSKVDRENKPEVDKKVDKPEPKKDEEDDLPF